MVSKISFLISFTKEICCRCSQSPTCTIISRSTWEIGCTPHNGKKWAEIELAIRPTTKPSATLVKLIKTIGVLSIVGEVIPNLKASEQLLRYALDDNTEGFHHEFEIALSTLKKRSRLLSIAVITRLMPFGKGVTLTLRQNSVRQKRRVDTKGALATDLSRYLPTRPLVARRHLFQTGYSAILCRSIH